MPSVCESMNEEKRDGTTGFAMVLAPFLAMARQGAGPGLAVWG